MTLQGNGLILSESINPSDIRMEAVGKGEVDDPINRTKRDSRFGPIPGQGIEPLSATTC
jgi:hypothetical protein